MTAPHLRAVLDPIPRDVDAELLRIAEGCAGPDYRLDAIGWSRFEYVDAVHRRLREKWRNEQRGRQ